MSWTPFARRLTTSKRPCSRPRSAIRHRRLDALSKSFKVTVSFCGLSAAKVVRLTAGDLWTGPAKRMRVVFPKRQKTLFLTRTAFSTTFREHKPPRAKPRESVATRTARRGQGRPGSANGGRASARITEEMERGGKP